MISPFLSTFERHAICKSNTFLVAIVLVTLVCVPAVKTFAQPGAARRGQGAAAQQPAGGAQSIITFDQFFVELDSLIPGDINKNPERKKCVEDAVTAFQLKDIVRVKKIFDDQKAKDREFPPTMLMLAGLSYTIKDLNTGRRLLEQTAIDNPNSPAVYVAFSRLALSEGRVTDGLALLEKLQRVIGTSELSKESNDYYRLQYLVGVADIAIRQQRFDDARKYLDQQIAMAPENPKTLLSAAELEFTTKNVEKSVEYLAKYHKLAPKTLVPEAVVASWFQRTGDSESADTWLTRAATRHPKSSTVQLSYANLAIKKGDFALARETINKVEAREGEGLESKQLKAKIAFMTESYVIAESHYQTLSEQLPNEFNISNLYALSLIESKDEAKQKKAQQIALRNFRRLPGNVIAQASLGYVFLKLGQIEQSRTAMAQAGKNPSLSPELGFFVASLLTKIDRKEEAKKVLTNALEFDGTFLYKSVAKKMLAELNKSQLPAPKQ